MKFDLIIKGGTIITAAETYRADIGISGGKITAVATTLTGGKKTVDAKGRIVIPGGVDVHTHLDMPFMGATTADDFASGTTGAVCGGTTSIIDFAIQGKGDSLYKALETWHGKADGKCAADYGFHMIISDLQQQQLKEMDSLVRDGVTTFKLFLAYPGIFLTDDNTIFKALLRTRENGGMIMMHAENGSVIDLIVADSLAKGKTAPRHHALSRPIAAEVESTYRSIKLAEMAGAPMYIVHLTAGDAMDEVRRARERGSEIYAETCPQYLYLSHDDYCRPGFEGAKFVMSPPLRPKGNQERLWDGVRQNWLQIVSTDHCSFNMKGSKKSPGKELGRKSFAKIPNGAPGLETRMMLLWDAVAEGRITANRFVDITATTPAKLFGLYPQKGTIAPGADADIAIINPKKPFRIGYKKLHMKVDYNPYEGRTVKGSIQDVFLRGKRMVDNGKFVGRLGDGRFLKRAPRMC
ncbi:MAG: dihydropyrimidinase [Elusimicrobiota bacterium]